MTTIISMVNANKFCTGVGIDDKLVWKCNVCKRSEMDAILERFGMTQGYLKT